jgi:hypothetical protein
MRSSSLPYLAFAAVTLIVVSSPAFAKCRGVVSKTITVYSENFQNAQRTATVKYDVTADLDICESGSAAGIDSRRCKFAGPRRLTRTITIAVPNKGETSIGEKMILLEPYNEDHRKNCNRVVIDEPQVWGGAHDRAIGTRSTWKRQIDEDTEEVKCGLELMGFVQ